MEKLVTLDRLFIDGNKIEANANKYSFVWKRQRTSFPPNFKNRYRRKATHILTGDAIVSPCQTSENTDELSIENQGLLR